MSYIKIKRRKFAIWNIWADFDDSGYKKLCLIVNSVGHFYEVRVEDKCQKIPVVLVVICIRLMPVSPILYVIRQPLLSSLVFLNLRDIPCPIRTFVLGL